MTEKPTTPNNPSDKTCSHCQSTALTIGVSVGLSAETGWIGLKYKDGRLFLGTEPFLAEVCGSCGHIERLYVSNPNHKWTIQDKSKTP